MRQLLKDGHVVDDNWILAADNLESLPSSGNVLLSTSQWEQFASELDQQQAPVGVWLAGNEEIPDFIESLLQLPIIAIKFAKFVDGRGYSLARLLRERYHYSGELRAIGDIIRDQLYLLKHSGFNAFQPSQDIDLEQAAASLTDFSENYQSTNAQPIPLFRRR
jgi:uncharacterized protein (DUF934 family)